jgi:hypothetical protein
MWYCWSHQFSDYFGPLAGRAFLVPSASFLNINTAPRTSLEAVDDIGEKTASAILIERKKDLLQMLLILKKDFLN